MGEPNADVRCRAVCVLYACGAALMFAPSLAIVLALQPRIDDLPWMAMVLLFSPTTGLTLAAGAWFASIAWRSGRDRVIPVAHLRAGECLAAVAGMLAAGFGAQMISAQARSAARGGGLLGGLGEAVVAIGGVLLVVAIGSRMLRSGATDAGAVAPQR